MQYLEEDIKGMEERLTETFKDAQKCRRDFRGNLYSVKMYGEPVILHYGSYETFFIDPLTDMIYATTGFNIRMPPKGDVNHNLFFEEDGSIILGADYCQFVPISIPDPSGINEYLAETERIVINFMANF